MSVQEPEVMPLPSRWFRRAMVVGVGITCGAFIPAFGGTPRWFGGYTLLWFILLYALDRELLRSTQRLANAPDRLLDERQIDMRNRVHQQAYRMLAFAFGLPLLLAFLGTGSDPTWLGGLTRNTGVLITYLELVFFLPTMVLAWTEQEQPVGDTGRHIRIGPPWATLAVGAALLVVSVGWSCTVLMPVQGWSTIKPLEVSRSARAGTSSHGCSYFGAKEQVGRGLVHGTAVLNAEVCWNGKSVWQTWGLNRNDCFYSEAAFTRVDMRCGTRFSPDGAMHVTYNAAVTPILLLFLSRQTRITLIVKPNGTVARFP